MGQYCQGQAQEITVEVILCKYSRQTTISRSRIRHVPIASNVVFYMTTVFEVSRGVLHHEWLVVARKLTTS